MQIAFVAAVVAALAVAGVMGAPKISDDFTANAEIIQRMGEHHVSMKSTIWESFTAKSSRVDATGQFEHGAKFEIIRLFGTGMEYEIRNNQTCHSKAFNQTMHPAFQWIEGGLKSQHPCHSRYNKEKEQGVLWTRRGSIDGHDFEGALCVDKAETEPYWVDFRAGEYNRLIHFMSFTPGAPAPKYFTVPSVCKK